MAKCEVLDLTLSDSGSDGDFIQAKKAKVEPKSLSLRYRPEAHRLQGSQAQNH